jgi:hypothetical protein
MYQQLFPLSTGENREAYDLVQVRPLNQRDREKKQSEKTKGNRSYQPTAHKLEALTER